MTTKGHATPCNHGGHHHGGFHGKSSEGAHHHGSPLGVGDRASLTLVISISLNLFFVGCEAFAGWYSDSVALLADAGHNLGDVLGLALSLFAIRLALRPPTERHTWGLKRSTMLASLANAVALLAVVMFIAREAAERLMHPREITTGVVVVVAAIGIVVNSLTAWLLHRHNQSDVNIRGAFLHMLADAAVSVGVVLSALLMNATGWWWVDSAVSFLIAGVILAGTWGIFIESLRLNLDGVPEGLDIGAVKASLAQLPHVTEVYDLHVWRTSTTTTALSAHIVRRELADHDQFLIQASSLLQKHYGIAHATLQVETARLSLGCEAVQ